MLCWAATLHAESYTFVTLAGNSGSGFVDGLRSSARLYNPTSVAVDQAGNLYVADYLNNTIRKITPAGAVSTLAGLAGAAGTTDATGSDARFNRPTGVAVDSQGNVYVADSLNNTIRKITPAGVVSTLAGLAGVAGSDDGSGAIARFSNPYMLATDAADNLYVTDSANNTVRKVTPEGVVSTLAGLAGNWGTADGLGSTARFNTPAGVAADRAGNLYICDYGNSTIRKITPAGLVSTLAGLAGSAGSADGTGNAARFNSPVGVGLDSATNLYVADYGNQTIRKVSPARAVTTWAGLASASGSADGTGTSARFNGPNGIAVDSSGNVFVADNVNCTIRKITAGRLVSTFAGLAGGAASLDGRGSAARLNGPNSVAVNHAGTVYVADETGNTIRKITSGGVVSTLAGLADVAGSANGTGSAARFNHPEGVCVDNLTNVYVADQYNHTIRKISPGGAVTTLAGLAGVSGSANGTGSAARFNNPSSVAVDDAGIIYVADYFNETIRKITPAGAVSTLAGSPGLTGSANGTGSAARFDAPYGVAVDRSGNVYVAEVNNCTIRKITPGAVVSTVAGLAGATGSADGIGAAARFAGPNAVAVDAATNLYVADSSNFTIRKITAAQVVTTLAGTASVSGNVDGTDSTAQFNLPYGIAVDDLTHIYVADFGNNTIRQGIPRDFLPSTVLSTSPAASRPFVVGMTGLPGLRVVIETSVNLSQWFPFGSSVLENGTNWFVGPWQNSDQQFYRTIVP